MTSGAMVYCGGAAIILVFMGVNFAQENPPVRPPETITGRWDVTVTDGDVTYPSWFEIRKSGHKTLVGSYVGRFGSARPISKVEFDNGSMRFVVPPQWEDRASDIVVQGRLEGDVMRGETTNDKGDRIRWEARRAPALLREPLKSWDKSIDLFNGRDLAGWKPQFPDRKNGWQVRDGVLANVEPGNNIVTQQQFSDFQLRAEIRYPAGSNSGIYLRGRYEVQIEDNFGQEADSHKIGGIYGFLTPIINAARPAGQWQSFDITLVGRRVTVALNHTLIIDQQVIPGITGGALDSNEGEPGPILIQGDHGPVEFRVLTITPMKRE